MAVATVTGKGQITLPKRIRDQLHLKAGDKVDFREDKDGQIHLVPISREIKDVFGCLSAKVKKSLTVEDMNAAIRRRSS